jgi:hypothetical protein
MMRHDLRMLGAAVLVLASPAAASTSFPKSLQAQWTDNLANCGGEDVGGMRVRANNIQFYEAAGTPKSIRTDEFGTIRAELTYRGEGRTWTELNTFVIAKDRASVRVTALGQAFTLKRCS